MASSKYIPSHLRNENIENNDEKKLKWQRPNYSQESKMDLSWRRPNSSIEKVSLTNPSKKTDSERKKPHEKLGKPINIRPVSLKTIEELRKRHPEQILVELFNPSLGLDNYLNEEKMGEALIKSLVSTFLKTFECVAMEHYSTNLTNKLLDSKFFNNILYESIGKENQGIFGYDIELFKQTLKLITEFLYLNPYAINQLSSMRDRLELLIKFRINNQELNNLLDKFLKKEQDCKDKIRKRKNKTFANIESNLMEPDNDFTDMTIVPKLSDILVGDQEVFLRKNITNGSYKSVHHYLDVQFRLLREDFMKPLREGVGEFRKIVHGSNHRKTGATLSKEIVQKIKKIDYLNTYFDVFMSASVASDQGIVFEMQLNQEKFKSINWETSKRLIFGSLVCFSSDHFLNECLIGVISERDDKNFKQHGRFNVKFDYDAINLDKNCIPELNRPYVMLETSAFFESYKHVLRALQSFQREGEENFPFKENLVFCQNREIPMPNYLKNACIDFSPLVDDSKKIEYGPKDNEPRYEFSSTSSFAERCFLSNSASWPTAEQMRLDKSQYEAVRLALTNKLALIQGPPGTGKTYLGVKLIQLLLHNKHSWWNRGGEKHKPILMICYTNHALDQFLEYCIRECNLTKGIVRVGGRSNSSKLEPYFLKNIKFQERGKNRNTIHYGLFAQSRSVAKIKSTMNTIYSNLNAIYSGQALLPFNVLKNILTNKEFTQLFGHSESNFNNSLDENYSLIDWLGLLNASENNLLAGLFSNMNISAFEEEEIKPEEFKETQEFDETDNQNDERMLEDDFELNEALDKNPQENNERPIYNNEILYVDKIYNIIIEDKKRKSISKNETNWFVIQDRKKVDSDFLELQQMLERIFSRLLTERFDESKLKNIENIWDLSRRERFGLYLSWINEYYSIKKLEIQNLSNEYNQAVNVLQELRLQEDRVIMEEAYIIAMTTTGSSRYHSVLKDIGPRIVIVEEAAEVFEAHIVSSLSKHCEHLILIGDHVQLRPNPAVYSLATQYKLDVSLFERLINNDTKRVMLNNQHRMRPEISTLMKHFYGDTIKNDKSVFTYPNIRGLTKNIYFIGHSEMEKRLSDNTTKINYFEAQYLAKLCSYLVKQDYDQSKITVLTMYLGQMMEIRKLLRSTGLNGVKVSTVDNYQGEENDIILLSLVRSNPDGKIGFLSIKNRVCVALSRARHGFYTIGNLNFISQSEKGNLWSDLIKTLKENNNYGHSLTVTCGSHPQNDVEISKAEHFDQRPDGGCLLPCGYRLKCGHVCTKKCHSNYDQDHLKFECMKNCDKPMERCGHLCKQVCSSEHKCNKCGVMMGKSVPECGHIIKLRCDQEPLRTRCTHSCEKYLECGHKCTKMCRDIDCGRCMTKIEVVSPCKHSSTIQVFCSDPQWTYKTKCSKPCREILACGHRCTGTCGQCYGGLIHVNCSQNCDRMLFCGHKCSVPCSKQCQPCQKECKNKCKHSECPRKCSDPCAPCLEECTNKCKHSKCSKTCDELCDRKPCDEPCDKLLKCGHPCIGLCGESCIDLCRICHKNKVNEIFFGTEDEPNAKFIRLKDCGHILEISGLDEWIYSRFSDENNNNQNNKDNTIQLPECPKCKSQIRISSRYSNIIKQQLNSIEQIKLKYYGDEKENKKLTENIIQEIDRFRDRKNSFDFKFLKLILDKLELEHNTLSFNSLAALQNTLSIFLSLKKLEISVNSFSRNERDHIQYEIGKILDLLIVDDQIAMFRVGQKLNDLSLEIERISKLKEFYRFCNQSKIYQSENSFRIAILLDQLEKILVNKIIKFEDCYKNQVDENLKELGCLLRTEITKEEKMAIVKAIGLSVGHWYKCPNGHIYCIGECGGAMERTICPECKADIGGQNHRMVSGNQLATEMDGATEPAWPTAFQN
ncbi:unnamed protein product [Brachionus calyciflorus]|uniref:RZ-type domain-containing protein n=1 Tax=Brachionus calyciflorus TaxID=104777 RepID=A0A814A0R3_9BILA|nr:unnamed protein product [Brachionus calyciflorus]